MSADELAASLSGARKMKGLSLAKVAEPAGISATYLQKLERGEVREPSPHVVHRLSEQLGLPYVDLMQQAGYVMPDRRSRGKQPRSSPLANALANEPLTDDESRAMVEYLAFLRQRRP